MFSYTRVDEIVLDGRDRQRARGRVGADDLFVVSRDDPARIRPSVASQRLAETRITRWTTFSCVPPRHRRSDYTSGTLSEVHRALPAPRRCRRTGSRPGCPGRSPRSPRAISRAIAMPFGRRRLRPVGPPHPVEQRVRHPHAGHLVGHELGVARALERKHAGDDRQPRATRSASGSARTPARSKIGRVTTNSAPASTLYVEPPQLLVEVRRRRIHRHADVERRSARRSPGRRRRSRG